MDRERKDAERAFVLHRRPFRDSSQIIDIFSRNDGRLALVARGARSRRSRYRGVLQPFMPLELGWSIRGDLGTLTGAEPAGRATVLGGDALLAGFYVNELLLRLTHRHDPHPEVFEDYVSVISGLASPGQIDAALRVFEFRLLKNLGYGIQLEHDIVTGAALEREALYRVRPDEGPMPVSSAADGGLVFSGADLSEIAAERFSQPDVQRAARKIARAAIDICLDGRELKTRKVMYAIHNRRRTIEKDEAGS